MASAVVDPTGGACRKPPGAFAGWMMASAVVDPTGVPVGGRGCLCRVDNGQGVARGCLPRCFPGLKCSYVVLSGVKWPWGTLSGTYVAPCV